MTFKLTYATMFNPPEELHGPFDAAMSRLSGTLGRQHPLHIAGVDRPARQLMPKRNPADHRQLLGEFGPDLRYVWRHLPLNDVHAHAQMAAEASEAAAAEDRFWEYYDSLFEDQQHLIGARISGQLVDQCRHQPLNRTRGRRAHPPGQPRPGPVQRGQHVTPEPGRVAIAVIQAQPRHRPAAAAGPVRQQRRFA